MSAFTAKAPNKHFILGLLFVGWLLDYLDRMVMSVAIVSIKEDFNLDPATVGVVLSSFFLAYAIMQIPGGWLSDKFGSRKIVLLSIIVWSAFTVMTGLAWGLVSLIVIRFLFGIGQGGYPSASQKGISDFFPRNERSKASATMMSSNYFGIALAPLVAAPMLIWFGWRMMFVIIGAVGILMALVFWFKFRPPNQSGTSDEMKMTNKVPLKELLRNAALWKIVIMWFGAGIVNWGLATWMPTYLSDVRGMDILAIGFAASLPGILGGLAVVVSGPILEKFFVNREKYFAAIGMIISTIFLYLMFTTTSLIPAMIYWNLCIIFKTTAFTVAFSLPHKMLSKKAIGSAMGMVNMGAQAAGFIAPLVMGLLISATGTYSAAFWFLIASALVSILGALSIKHEEQSVDNQEYEASAQ
ncbi:MFS transporter [Pseudalkalibacillus decolorationis]|uniref:MFS transporter n=1 Tax=Pseudalkalibacillus decolorationis TaxID=163879 RepID=UPI002147EF36|nr:MFS transporter [Pseudalkalibacillus decolorationis]